MQTHTQTQTHAHAHKPRQDYEIGHENMHINMFDTRSFH